MKFCAATLMENYLNLIDAYWPIIREISFTTHSLYITDQNKREVYSDQVNLLMNMKYNYGY